MPIHIIIIYGIYIKKSNIESVLFGVNLGLKEGGENENSPLTSIKDFN
jgi:hypothetical protein